MGASSLRRAVFLDRDGVINREVDHLVRAADIRLLPGAASAIARLNARGYVLVVVTNQSAIARGMISEDEAMALNQEMARRLAKHNALIDAWYCCPHYPKGTIKKYAVHCSCRKPEVGMFVRAKQELGINMEKSFMIGDTTGDILAGHRAGLTTILVKTGYGGTDKRYDVAPDFIVKNLGEALLYLP